jgi:very-short-patch-repair endonuclease
VAFVPVHYWSYKWYAIQLDAAHDADRSAADRLRDEEVAVQGYEVISLRPSREGYLGEVKRLLEQIERDMTKVEADGWSVALQLQVARTESNAAPF